MIGKKLNYIEVKQYIESFDYKLLSTNYINALTKLELQCPKDHIYFGVYGNFQQGIRCPECSGLKRKTLRGVKEYIESFGYELLSTEYKNSKEKLELQCPKKHIFKMSYDCFQRGQRCPECANKMKGDSQRLEINNVKEYIEGFGYKLLSTEYKNVLSNLRLECLNGHKFLMRYNSFQQGQRCPKCSYINKSSKPEKEIAKYVKTIYSGKMIENDRTQVKNYWSSRNLELDIFLPELSKAIEFNGIYWHSNDKTMWCDEMKKKQCIQKGINLLVIEDKDWYNDKLCCLNKINELIGVRCLI